MKAHAHSRQPALVLMMAIGVLWPAGETVAETKNQKPAQADKASATQSIDLGNVGEKARIDIKQVQGVDPKELAKVLDMLAKRDADARKAEQRVAELEAEQRKARESGVNRVLTQAAQPDADDLAKRARVALLQGDSRLAEQLLRQQEDRAASAAEQGRREAAEVAREIAALAIGRNSQTALAALERAAKYQPEDFWTQVQLGDAQLVLGKSATAMISYQAAFSIAQALAARDPANTGWQRDLSVSHNKIGDVLVAQGDGPGALVAFRKGLAIGEALAARDPANTGWQRDLSVSHDRIGDVLVAQGDGPGALVAFRKGLAIGEALAARDPANTGWQVDVAVSCSRLGTHVGLNQSERRAYLQRGLAILRRLKDASRLLPNQDWTAWFETALQELAGSAP